MPYIDVEFEFEGETLTASIKPIKELYKDGIPDSFLIMLNYQRFGEIKFDGTAWNISGGGNPLLVQAIGEAIHKKMKF